MAKSKAHDEERRIEEIHAHVDDLTATAETLRQLGEESDLPALERNAKRIEGIADVLDRNLPPETLDEE